jgi:hypothetical protein
LDAKEWVYGIHVNGESKAYPLKQFDDNTLVHDSFQGKKFILIGNEDELTVRAFVNTEHKFTMSADGILKDDLGKNWLVYEDSLVSEDKVSRLDRYPGHLAYWFAWYQFFMDTDVYEAENKN